MKPVIRNMQPNDWDAVSRIFSQAIEVGGSTFRTECPSFESWDASHLKVCRLVMTLDEKIIGWCALSPTSSMPAYKGSAELSIYIDSAFKSHGFGSALLTRLCEESEKAGIWSLCSVIFENNAASTALHKKCGFRLVGKREKIAKDRFGCWQNTVIYERRSSKII